MVGDGSEIVHAPWSIFRHLTGWDLRNLKNLDLLYAYPEQRRLISNTLKHKYHCRQIVEINTGYGFPLSFDAIYTRKPSNNGLYYIFLHLMDFTESKKR